MYIQALFPCKEKWHFLQALNLQVGTVVCVMRDTGPLEEYLVPCCDAAVYLISPSMYFWKCTDEFSSHFVRDCWYMQIFLVQWDGNLVCYYYAIAVLSAILAQEHHCWWDCSFNYLECLSCIWIKWFIGDHRSWLEVLCNALTQRQSITSWMKRQA